MIINELSISYDDTAMTPAALSFSSLLDRVTCDAVSETELDEMIARTGFKAVSLKHMMVQTEHCISHLPGQL